jgi:putative thioredoxin
MALILDNDDLPIGGGKTPAADLVKDATAATFAQDVIEASKATPVIVDFWAPWCGPCKTLGPLLEKLVRRAGGLVRMVKVNVDENQELAMQFRVQSIPAVYAFKAGRPVDGFMGAVPESQIKAFIDRLTGGAKAPGESALEAAAEALAAGEAETALAAYAEILGQEPDNATAAGGIVRACVAMGDLARARRILDDLPANLRASSEVAGARSALELAEQAQGGGADLQGLRARLAKDAKDHQARYDLAAALHAAGRTEEAIGELVELVRLGRTWNDEAGRRLLVKIFEALGHAHPLTVAGRRQLSSVLFS